MGLLSFPELEFHFQNGKELIEQAQVLHNLMKGLCKSYNYLISMNPEIEKLTAGSLRQLLIREMKKFIVALKYDSTASDLEEIRDHIRELMNVLTLKEKEETFSLSHQRENYNQN